MAGKTKEAPAQDQAAEKPADELLNPDDVFRADVTEQIAKQQQGDQAPPPAVSEPGPGGDGGTPSANAAPEHGGEREPTPLSLTQLDDGRWQIGNFVGATVEEVAQKAAEAHRNSSQQMHRKATELDDLRKTLSLDDDEDGDEYIDDAEWQEFQRFQQGAQQHQQGGQPLSQYEIAQMYRFSERVLDNAHAATPKQWEQAAINALTLGDDTLYQQIVGEWHQVDQPSTTRFLHDIQQAQQAIQQHAVLQQQQAAQAQQQALQAESTRALETAWGVFQQEAGADLPQLDAGIRHFLASNPYLMPAAQQHALQTRSAEPILQVYRMAAQHVRATLPPSQAPQVPANYNPATGTFQQTGAAVDPSQQQNHALDQKRAAEVGLGGASDIAVNTGGNAPEGQAAEELDAFIRLINGPEGLEPYK
jgi:hypothetical protein